MHGINLIRYISSWINKLTPQFPLQLKEVIFSEQHGHNMCIIQHMKKSIQPLYSPHEILSTPELLDDFSPQDAVIISQLDFEIRQKKQCLKVTEIDINGSVVLAEQDGTKRRYSERYFLQAKELIHRMQSSDAFDLGYRIGHRLGKELLQKQQAEKNLAKLTLINV